MKKLLLVLALCLLPAVASAQCSGVFTTGTVCGNATGSNNPPRMTPSTSFVPSLANPTASVGLTVVNGVATSAMRSDAAPPLSSSVQSALTGTNHGVALGTGAFGFGSTAAGAAGIPLIGQGAANPIFGTAVVGGGGTGATSFTANLPLIGNGTSPLTQGTRSGNTTSFATTSGTLTSGNCVKIDANGNLVDAGAACSASTTTTLIELSGFSYYLGCTNSSGCYVSITAGTFTNVLNTGTNTKPVKVVDNLSELNITTGAFVPTVTGNYEVKAVMEGASSSATGQTILVCGWTTTDGTQPSYGQVFIETQGGPNLYSNSHTISYIQPLTASTTYYFNCWPNNNFFFNNLLTNSSGGGVPTASNPIIDFVIRRFN